MIKFTLTLDDFMAAQKLHIGLKRVLYLASIFVIIAAISLWNEYHGDGTPNWSVSIGALVFLAIFMFSLSPLMYRRRLKKAFFEQKTLQEETSVSYNEHQIEWITPSGSFHTKWSDIPMYKIGKGIILIYETKRLIRMIPQRVLSGEDIEAIKDHLQNRNTGPEAPAPLENATS